jgi:DNA-binding IclR family transcriptional regulator
VATGKALLAHQRPEVIASIAANLERFTPRTITKPEALYGELERVRRDRYAINRGQWREGVGGVAAPIRDGSGTVVAAVGISGPTDRLRLKVLRGFAPLVIATADKISRALGYTRDTHVSETPGAIRGAPRRRIDERRSALKTRRTRP